VSGETLHTADCQCQRCRGFEPGNGVAIRHGGYASPIHLQPRASEIAMVISERAPFTGPEDHATIGVLAIVLARLEASASALEDAEPAAKVLLARDMRGWANTAARYFDLLALAPTSRGRLGLDVARTREAVRADLLREYGGGDAA
jgi:hypothetical protein